MNNKSLFLHYILYCKVPLVVLQLMCLDFTFTPKQNQIAVLIKKRNSI